jgi:hypothetical protein
VIWRVGREHVDVINNERNLIRTHHLLSTHSHRLDAELSVAHVEEILEIWAQEVDYEHVVKSFLTKVIDLRYASY